jgi:two-component system cell cycle sensor histidine kinase/response regulator CckA
MSCASARRSCAGLDPARASANNSIDMASRNFLFPIKAEDLPDPIEWPRLPGAQRHMALVIAGAVLAGLASTLLIAWAMQAWEIAALYAGLILAATVVGYFSALGRARRGAGGIDWSIVRTALDSRSDALAVTDASGRLVCANAAYGARCGGYPSPLELAGGDDETRASLANVAQQALRDGNGFIDLEQLVNGARRRMRVSVRSADAGKSHLIWTLRRSRTDKAIDDTRAMLEGPVGVWLGQAGLMAVMADQSGTIMAANGAFRSAVGESGVSAPGNLVDLFNISDRGTKQLRTIDGAVPVRVIELPMGNQAERTAGVYLFLILREAHDAIAAGPQAVPDNLPALLSALPIGLAIADRDGRFMFMNDSFVAAAAIEQAADVLYPSDLVIDEDKTMVSDAVRRAAAASHKARDLRVHLKHKPDEPVALTVGRAPAIGGPAVILSLKDNREQLKLEKQIAQATKMQAVGQLAGGVAHDFNNILTAVIGYCDLMLLRHTPGDSDFDDINQIRQNANRAANLVRQLLAFSRQQTLRPQLVQVSDIVGELSHLLKRLLGETVTLNVKHGRNLAPVRTDPGQMEQVIVNLAVNARDAMLDGGELTISTFAVTPREAKKLDREGMPPADYVAIAVKDTGTGIPADILPKIFEPFFTTKEVGRGTGLGLSTVYGIVKQSGGYIFADSEVGVGTTFTIYLPAQEPAADDADAGAVKPDEGDPWGQGKILLVEDEAMVRAVAERALTRKGYDVLTAAHGEEALEMLERMPDGIDLLISDVVMPTMDGPTLVRHARQRFPELRIIFMSGYAEEQLRRSIDVPGVAFLAKPFSVQELSDKVRGELARGKRPAETAPAK